MACKVLIVDDEANIRFAIGELLKREGFNPDEASNGQQAVAMVEDTAYDIVLLDVRMPKMDGLTALKHIRKVRPEAITIVITAHGTEKTAIEALENGAYDYFTKPFDVNEVRVVVRRAAEKARLLQSLREMRRQSESRYAFQNIIGQSAPMRDLFRMVERVLDNDVTVLVTGESGTGKELVASAIHYNGPRRDGPFIKVNTAAIPETLLESEMFGHERGAFTGAVAQKIGRVEAASGGTLFLDEIGDMPPSLQAKLLRALQEREIERVGSTKPIKVDIRVVAATHHDLEQMVKEGTFREDLFYRVNVMPLHLPPLRARREDIPLLVDHFINSYNPRLSRNIRGVAPEALDRFLAYPWPGNIRELENLVQRSMLMAGGDVIELDDLPPAVRGGSAARRSAAEADAGPGHEALQDLDLSTLLDTDDFRQPLAERLSRLCDHIEQHLIRAALDKTGGHRQETADLLGISRKSLHNKMVRYAMFDE